MAQYELTEIGDDKKPFVLTRTTETFYPESEKVVLESIDNKKIIMEFNSFQDFCDYINDVLFKEAVKKPMEKYAEALKNLENR